MKGNVQIFNTNFEYDFLSGWIKYNRIKNEMSQEALSYGICSTSHLSFFENGKKKLRADIIEALLKKLNISEIIKIEDIGLIRQKFHTLRFQIESFSYSKADEIYQKILELENLLSHSPYSIEYRIYQLMYNIMVERNSFEKLESEVKILDKIYPSLNDDLKYSYMLSTGKLIYDFKDHSEGIRRLLIAHNLQETSWTNYRLGVAYCHHQSHLKATYYLEKALESYEKNGRYYNALWCHNFLGTCYKELRIFDKAEFHFKTVLNGSDYFSENKTIWGIYNNLASLYIQMSDFEESLKWSSLAMNTYSREHNTSTDKGWIKAAWHMSDEPMLGACNKIEALINLNRVSECDFIFDKYLKEEFSCLKNYKYLKFLNLKIYNLHEDIFYQCVTKEILPYYEKIGFLNIVKKIKLVLIEHLESKRKYKEANKIYKEILNKAL